MSDKIELNLKFEDVDMSDPSKMSDEDFVRVWIKECFFWHNRLLEGEKQHYCPEWDFMPIDETCDEFQICTCNLEKKNG